MVPLPPRRIPPAGGDADALDRPGKPPDAAAAEGEAGEYVAYDADADDGRTGDRCVSPDCGCCCEAQNPLLPLVPLAAYIPPNSVARFPDAAVDGAARSPRAEPVDAVAGEAIPAVVAVGPSARAAGALAPPSSAELAGGETEPEHALASESGSGLGLDLSTSASWEANVTSPDEVVGLEIAGGRSVPVVTAEMPAVAAIGTSGRTVGSASVSLQSSMTESRRDWGRDSVPYSYSFVAAAEAEDATPAVAVEGRPASPHSRSRGPSSSDPE